MKFPRPAGIRTPIAAVKIKHANHAIDLFESGNIQKIHIFRNLIHMKENTGFSPLENPLNLKGNAAFIQTSINIKLKAVAYQIIYIFLLYLLLRIYHWEAPNSLCYAIPH